MPTPLREERVATLGDYTRQIEEALARTQGQPWYRGAGKSSYTLSPSLFRHPDPAIAGEINELFGMERKLLASFRQRSLPFLPRSLGDDWDCLFLMQHFQVPTRLLDWTENPHVALFFALSSAQPNYTGTIATYADDAVVWVLDPVLWNRRSLRDNGYAKGILSFDDSFAAGYTPVGRSGVDLDDYKLDPVAIYGTHNSVRIVAQRGVFTISGKNISPMERIYQDSDYPADSLVKLIIPQDRIGSLLDNLIASGITDSVVYPDLQGLGLETRRLFKYRM